MTPDWDEAQHQYATFSSDSRLDELVGGSHSFNGMSLYWSSTQSAKSS
jgi:hypothetical protein